MIPSCCPWKVVIFFGKEHVNRHSISGVMIGLSWKIEFGKVHYLFGKSINSKCLRALLLGQRQKWMFPSCFPWKVVIFFGKEHVNQSNISGVMIELIWEIMFGKINYLFGQNVNLKFQNTSFIGSEIKMDDSILLPVKISYIFW